MAHETNWQVWWIFQTRNWWGEVREDEVIENNGKWGGEEVEDRGAEEEEEMEEEKKNMRGGDIGH